MDCPGYKDCSYCTLYEYCEHVEEVEALRRGLDCEHCEGFEECIKCRDCEFYEEGFEE